MKIKELRMNESIDDLTQVMRDIFNEATLLKGELIKEGTEPKTVRTIDNENPDKIITLEIDNGKAIEHIEWHEFNLCFEVLDSISNGSFSTKIFEILERLIDEPESKKEFLNYLNSLKDSFADVAGQKTSGDPEILFFEVEDKIAQLMKKLRLDHAFLVKIRSLPLKN